MRRMTHDDRLRLLRATLPDKAIRTKPLGGPPLVTHRTLARFREASGATRQFRALARSIHHLRS